MRKYRSACGWIVLVALVVWAAPMRADVKTQEKSLVKLGGALGKMVSMFGGKGMREGIVSTVAVKGDRKARITDKTEQIIDLKEEKIYDIDLEDKSYTVTTFAELRKKMEEARQRAKENADKRASKNEEEPKKAEQEPQVEVDFDLKDTGEKKTIAGHDTHEVVMTITVREKGKTLEDGGGMVLTSDMWIAPDVPEMKEIAQFEQRYFQQLYGPMLSTQEMQQFAAAVAAHPMMKDAMARYQKERVNMNGTPISTIVTFDAVASKQAAAEQSKKKEDDDSTPTTGGGMFGSLAKRIAKKKAADDDAKDKEGKDAGPKNRATIMTMTNDVLKIEPSVSTADVSVPAGFKLKS
jgi:hypothetical protein